jgi:hypothetical protein
MADYQIHALISNVWHYHIQDPRLFVVYLSPADCKTVWIFHISLDVINCRESAPRYQLSHSLHLGLRFNDKEYLLTYDYEHIDLSPFLHFLTLLIL